MRRAIIGTIGAVLLAFTSLSYAEVIHVWQCQLNEGRTADDAHAVSAAWLKAARSMDGGADVRVHVNWPLAAEAADGQFLWVLVSPGPEAWGQLMGGYEDSAAQDADAAFEEVASCSSSSLWASYEME